MSSRRYGRNTRGRISTEWSEWKWDPIWKCESRYRELSRHTVDSNAVEYEYRDSASQSARDIAADFGGLSLEQTHEYQYDDGKADGEGRSTTHKSLEPIIEPPEDHFSCTWPSCELHFDKVAERDRHYLTVHANNGERPYICLVEGCQARVKSWTRPEKLRDHNKTWHGPYHCRTPGCPRGVFNGFKSESELKCHITEAHKDPNVLDETLGGDSQNLDDTIDTHHTEETATCPKAVSYSAYSQIPSTSTQNQTPGYSNEDNYIQHGGFVHDHRSTPQPQSTMSRFRSVSHHIYEPHPETDVSYDPEFRSHQSWEFKFGRVFKVLWSEPKGSAGTDISDDETTSTLKPRKYGEPAFHKIRRFVVVDPRRGHAICLPIMTYRGQGTLKRGVHALDHAAIYTGKRPSVNGKEKLVKKAIRMVAFDPKLKLDKMSRINYTKLYTVEHNVKVCFIGAIAPKYEQQVVTDYNATHKPLPDRPYYAGTFEESTFGYVQGPDPGYSAPASSSSWPAADDMPSSTSAPPPATANSLHAQMTLFQPTPPSPIQRTPPISNLDLIIPAQDQSILPYEDDLYDE